MEEQEFITGYNDGLRLAQYSSRVAQAIRDYLPTDTEYSSGLLEGIQEYDRLQEKTNQRVNDLKEIDESQEQEQNYDNDIE